MRYALVMVAESSYQKQEPLTYSTAEMLPTGTLVMVPFGRKSAPGVVVGQVKKPLFDTKPIGEIISPVTLPETSLRLMEWMSSYYPSGSGARVSTFIPSGLNAKFRVSAERYNKSAVKLPSLTKEQLSALATINTSKHGSFLLHGETGSGKTRLYLERAKHAITDGKSVLILAPEISLVPQLAQLFGSLFGDKVVVIHSGLGRAKRNQAWLNILHSEEPMVVIGTRSALFAPVKNLGFVVVDEMHEPAYKHEQAPYYHGLRVAGQIARLHKAEIIYGSATPPIVEYYVAEQTSTPILRMRSTAKIAQKIDSSIVDMRDASRFTRNQHISDELLAAIEQRLSLKEQSLLFLNRRGTARLVLCQTCGWQALCPRCDMPLVYHGDTHVMRCHNCGYMEPPPLACPVCGSDDVVYRSMGTKALADVVSSQFPHAVVRRFDTDNTADEQLGRNFEAVKSGEVDIIVGTQILGKGLDLPKLSLVGIVNAETSLGMPDYSSSERNYQLLHQAIGRVGRGHLHGQVIVQSFNPENPLLLAALHQRWHDLYEYELKERKAYNFPPFVFLLKLTVTRKKSDAAENYTHKLHHSIADMKLPVTANDPTPSFYERTRGEYNWQIIVKAKQRSHLVSIVNQLPKGDYSYDLDPINLL